jgi:recombination DNA repair RAD52 pathway protein
MEVDIVADDKVIQDQQQDQHQDQQEEMIAKAEYDKVLAELEEVKSKLPKELTDEEKALQAKQQELWQKEVSLSLKEAGLEKFADIVKVNDEKELKDVIKKLTSIVNDLKIEMGYVPNEHKQMTAYEQAKKQGNTVAMIKSLFGMN